MEITREEVQKLVRILPGSAAVYRVGDSVQRLAFTNSLPALFGYSPEEFSAIADAAETFILPADRELLQDSLRSHSLADGETECSFRVHKKDGSDLRVVSRARKIGEMDGAPVILSILTRATLDEIQLDMLNRMPVGVGLYRIERGIPSLVFLNDSYYQLMGFTREERTIYLGENSIYAVHPDDRASIYASIKSILSGMRLRFVVSVRMLTGGEPGFLWVQLDGRIAKRDGATVYLYVSFTRIDALKQAQDALQKTKAELEKNQLWLQAAMDTAGLQYFEYFPAQSIAVGYQSHNRYGIPHVLKNYPDCLFESQLAHPDDVESFRAFWQKVKAGISPLHWEGRLSIGEKYNWFHVIATTVHDADEQPVVTCTMADITLQKEAEEAYGTHLDSVLRSNPNTIASFRANITKNLCYNGVSEYESIVHLNRAGTLDGFLLAARALIPDEESRRQVSAAFSRCAMLKAFEAGKKQISVEHRFCLEPGHTEWITTYADFMRNPATGDIEGVLYTLNTSMNHIERTVLQNILQRSYDAISVVDVATDEYFLFEKSKQTHGKHFTGFFKEHDAIVQSVFSVEEWRHLSSQLCSETVQKMLAAQGSYSVNFFVKTPEGLRRKQVNYYYTDRTHNTLIFSLRDFSDKDLLEQFRYSSEHDPVTNLYNRKMTFTACRKLLEAHPEEAFYICHMDIQRFHLINSFYGEAEGNALLAGIGRTLAKCSLDFPFAVYGRIEADVFCFLVPDRLDTLERNMRAVKQWLKTCRSDFPVEANFGAYKIQDRAMPVEAMFTRATLAAKHTRNSILYHYSFFDDAMEDELRKEQQITNDMQTALQQEQFKVYLQPKYLLRNSTPCGAEALVRWEHPVKGMISPGDFIPLFEKNGFILKLDRYMWEHVCQLLRSWLDEGRAPAPISVNVSRVSMYSPSTVSFLHELVNKYRLPHDLMQLELTESAYMDDPEEMKRRLRQLQQDGFVILMDDFGSGYSSLNTLRELPVNYLKIDMRFLSAEADNDRSRLILAAVIRMACWLNLPVITEGVETPEQKEFLNGIGCTYAQGFLFARPMPVSRYEQEVLKAESPCAALPAEQLSVVASLITSTNETTQFLSEHLPVPMAFVDVSENEFTYIRANQEFQHAFGFGNDLVKKELLLEKHLGADEYRVLMNAYHSAAITEGKAECIFYWRDAGGAARCYLMHAQSIGKSAYSSILLATFADVTSYTRLSKRNPSEMHAFRNRYTAQGLAELLQFLSNIFDIARVVLPKTHSVLGVDTKWLVQQEYGQCFTCWNKAAPCENCISCKASALHRTLFKIEKRGLDSFFVFSYPLEIVSENGALQSAVLELVMKPSELLLESVRGTAQADEGLVEHYRQLAYRDPLTAVWNRRYFEDMLYLHEDTAFLQNPSIGFILLDLDDFKAINETLGREAGDVVLVETAAELRHNLRPFDSLIRYDGDEFLVVMPSCTAEEVRECAVKLCTMLRHLCFGEAKKLTLHASAGYSHTPHFVKDIAARNALLQQADARLLQSRMQNAAETTDSKL